MGHVSFHVVDFRGNLLRIHSESGGFVKESIGSNSVLGQCESGWNVQQLFCWLM
jgi:hypothetical protein